MSTATSLLTALCTIDVSNWLGELLTWRRNETDTWRHEYPTSRSTVQVDILRSYLATHCTMSSDLPTDLREWMKWRHNEMEILWREHPTSQHCASRSSQTPLCYPLRSVQWLSNWLSRRIEMEIYWNIETEWFRDRMKWHFNWPLRLMKWRHDGMTRRNEIEIEWNDILTDFWDVWHADIVEWRDMRT